MQNYYPKTIVFYFLLTCCQRQNSQYQYCSHLQRYKYYFLTIKNYFQLNHRCHGVNRHETKHNNLFTKSYYLKTDRSKISLNMATRRVPACFDFRASEALFVLKLNSEYSVLHALLAIHCKL